MILFAYCNQIQLLKGDHCLEVVTKAGLTKLTNLIRNYEKN